MRGLLLAFVFGVVFVPMASFANEYELPGVCIQKQFVCEIRLSLGKGKAGMFSSESYVSYEDAQARGIYRCQQQYSSCSVHECRTRVRNVCNTPGPGWDNPADGGTCYTNSDCTGKKIKNKKGHACPVDFNSFKGFSGACQDLND